MNEEKCITHEQLKEIFPAISQIKDLTVRTAVLDMWKFFFERGEWTQIEDAYFISACPAYSLVRHTNYVTEAAAKIAAISEAHLGISINWDILLASCLLHDVSKLVETVSDENGYHENPVGQQFQHAFLSASYAYEHGMPDDIVTNLITHTGDSKRVPTNVEGIILYYIDMIDTDLHLFEIGASICIEEQK